MRNAEKTSATSTSTRISPVRIRFVLAILMSLGCVAVCRGATTYTAASPEEFDVRAKIATASDGDTVIIPAGSAHWTNCLYINKAITLQGAGTNSAGSSSTIIYDDISGAAVNAPGFAGSLIQIDTTTNKFYRLSGIRISASTTRAAGSLGLAQVVLTGCGKAVRVDNCWFGATPFRQRAVSWYGATCGVIDHCTLLNPCRDVDVFHTTWGGGSYGDGSWADDSTVGTTNTVVIEDCYMEGSGPGQAFTDAFDGGRYCVRHCTLVNGHLDSHEGGNRTRATRQVEVYANNCIMANGNGFLLYLRGGSCLMFSNQMTGFTTLAVLAHYRSFVPYPTWGGLNGTNIWDNNATVPSATGKHTGADGATSVLVDANANWTANQWVGYALQNTTPGMTNAYGQLYSVVTANTANTITFYSYGLIWTNGNSYALFACTNGLDMCGMGKGDLISGDNPTPVGWPHQRLDPCYQWDNTPSNLPFIAQFGNMRERVHYYNYVAKPGYTPLVYPHPLVQAITNQPAMVMPPSNVRAFPAYAGR